MNRIRTSLLSFMIPAFLVFSGLPAAGADSRPNIVMVFIDDMGWGDFSCFGNEAVKTQHVDRLAEEGLRFHQFYVNAPICSPSRAALTTGLYPPRADITSYLASRELNEARGIAHWLDPEIPTLPRLLQATGYATGHFGKWHLGGQRDIREAPLLTEYGFDTSLTNFEGLGPRVLPLLDAYNGQKPRRHSLGSDKLGQGPIEWANRDQVTARFVEGALEFIREAQKSNRPFYINLWPDDVHSPFFPPKHRRGDESRPELYHGVLDTMDEQLGVLFDFVREDPELRDNTLILVCSDNGPPRGNGSTGPFRGFKVTLYEGGIRSPLVVWGPGLISSRRKGTVNEVSVFSALDLVPSILEIAGVPISPDHAFDGESLADSLLGKAERSRSTPLFFRRPPDRKRDIYPGAPLLPDLAVRSGDWKLMCDFDGSRAQLYDLTRDPGETRNLVEEHPEVVARLVDQVVSWNQCLPQDAGPYYERP